MGYDLPTVQKMAFRNASLNDYVMPPLFTFFKIQKKIETFYFIFRFVFEVTENLRRKQGWQLVGLSGQLLRD